MNDDILLGQAEDFVSMMPRLMRKLFSLDDDDPAYELPLAQLRVCSILRDGPHSMSTISREMGITLSAMTQIADRLERHGLVERVCETDDRRVKCLKLTSHGLEVMQRRKERRLRRVRQVLEHLPPDERKSVVDALHTLLDAAQSTEAGKASDIQAVEQMELI